jgi:adenylate kinase family enzyme
MPNNKEEPVKKATEEDLNKKKYPLSHHYLEFREFTKIERRKRIENFFKMTRKN